MRVFAGSPVRQAIASKGRAASITISAAFAVHHRRSTSSADARAVAVGAAPSNLRRRAGHRAGSPTPKGGTAITAAEMLRQSRHCQPSPLAAKGSSGDWARSFRRDARLGPLSEEQ